ncbi:MAG: cysteine dioxygenase family protein [Thermoleophilia bacterium]
MTRSPDITTSTELPPPPWPFPDLPDSLRFLEDIDRVHDASELVVIARRIVESGLWRDYVVENHEFRDYRLIFENEFTDIWALSWLPGQTTGFHDHDASEVGICVAHGAVREWHPVHEAPPLDHVIAEGATQEGPLGYIHQVAHEYGDPAVTIHAYSPPLVRVGQYRERDGRMIRLPEPGRTRLTPS